MFIKEIISKLVNNKDLSLEESLDVMMQIMEGKATDAQIASFITALRMKGETVEEITGCAMAMRRKAIKIKAEGGIVIDTCGTGEMQKYIQYLYYGCLCCCRSRTEGSKTW